MILPPATGASADSRTKPAMLGWRLLVSAILIPAFVVPVLPRSARRRVGSRSALSLGAGDRRPLGLGTGRLFRVRSFEPSFPADGVPGVHRRGLGVDSPRRRGSTIGRRRRIGFARLVFALARCCGSWPRTRLATGTRADGWRRSGPRSLIVAYVGLLLCLTAQLRWVGPTGANRRGLSRAGIADHRGQMRRHRRLHAGPLVRPPQDGAAA